MNNSKIEPAVNNLVRDGKAVPYYLNDGVIRTIVLLITVLCCILTATSYYESFGGAEPIEYPLQGSITQYDPYVQQFDAFMKGQLHFDYEPSEDFLAIENPYDPGQRDNVYYLYDRAYFEGKYYSYFGAAPIIVYMMPYYFIHGSLPSATQIQLVFMTLFSVFMPMLIYTIGEKLYKKLHPFMLALISYTAFISSLQLFLARGRTPFYYIAATSAMAFLSAFGYFFFKGVFSKNTKKACIMYGIAGLAFALCFHSRVNVAFGAAFIVVPVVIFGIILKKREAYVPADDEEVTFFKAYRCKDIILELCSLASFVVIGFIIAFMYNKARFGSILDFGSTYQLTIAEVSKYKLDVKEFGNSIFHYFLAPLREIEETGEITFGYWKIANLDRYIYIDAHFGILSVPFALLGLLMPFIAGDKKKSVFLRTTLICAMIGCVVMGWFDYCLGGVIYRYLCDFSVIFATVAAISAFAIAYRIQKLRSFSARFIGNGFFVAFLIYSVYFTFKIMAIKNGNLLEMDPDSFFCRLFATYMSN